MIKKPIQSKQVLKLKEETSLIGMAYLTYIYQNDIKNPHYCQSMLLMKSQVKRNTNPYEKLFYSEMASTTMSLLEDVQLSFDYSIARTQLPAKTVRKSVDKLRSVL